MSDHLSEVTAARELRDSAEFEFREALSRARGAHTMAEIARAAGLTVSGVYYLLSPTQAGRKKEDNR